MVGDGYSFGVDVVEFGVFVLMVELYYLIIVVGIKYRFYLFFVCRFVSVLVWFLLVVMIIF